MKSTIAFLFILSIICLGSIKASSSEAETGDKSKEGKSIPQIIKNMKPREQLRYLLEFKREHPEEKRIPFYMGNAMYALGKMDSAVIYYKEAIEADSSFSKVYVNLGLALDARGSFFGAERSFKQAIRLDPNDVLAYCHLGFLYYSRNKYNQAMDYYKRALKIDPNSAQAHMYSGKP